jgi:hypothetical protein
VFGSAQRPKERTLESSQPTKAGIVRQISMLGTRCLLNVFSPFQFLLAEMVAQHRLVLHSILVGSAVSLYLRTASR